MAHKNRLSKAEKEEILEDFQNWSGGFTPDQCPERGFDECTHQSYIEHAMDSKFQVKSEIVRDFLSDYPE